VVDSTVRFGESTELAVAVTDRPPCAIVDRLDRKSDKSRHAGDFEAETIDGGRWAECLVDAARGSDTAEWGTVNEAELVVGDPTAVVRCVALPPGRR